MPSLINLNHSSLIFVTAVSLLGAFGTCTATGPDLVDDDEIAVIVEDPAPELPPFIAPPSAPDEAWQIPGYGRSDPPFPYLPDEDQNRSLSVGTVTEGFLVNSRPLPRPHPHMAVLPRQFDRHLQYTSDAMLELIDDAASHVADLHPESVLYVGNFGRRGGGSIPHSVSHNNGRDADLAFYVVDEDGNPTVTPDLLIMDANGRYVGADDEDGEFPDLVLDFDAPRNWRLVEGLIESDAAELQYIFVSNPLRRMLLAEGRRQNASARTLRLAGRILVQPGGGAKPHDDHFHIRIHCSDRDLAAGCRERGRAGPTYRPDYRQADAATSAAESLLENDHPYWRRIAILRLDLVGNHDLYRRIASLIDDDDPAVRAAAIRSIGDQRFAFDALVDRLQTEKDPQVFAELVNALVDHGSIAVEPLLATLDRNDALSVSMTDSIPTLSLTADALARLQQPEPVPYLIGALATATPVARPQIDHTLRILTNHRFDDGADLVDDEQVDKVISAWQTWWDQYHDKERSQWVKAGFQQAGFAIEDFENHSVWELCRAITDDRHLNFNAQRILMNISGQSPQSLQWHPHDASFFWRRWFERRIDSLGLPPIPSELSTADGYTKPP